LAITALCPILNTGFICVGSADCCITIYDLNSQDVLGRITTLEHFPTAAECFEVQEPVLREAEVNPNNNNNNNNGNHTDTTGDNTTTNATTTDTTNTQSNGNNGVRYSIEVQEIVTYLVFGDSKGNLHFLKLHPEFGISSEIGLKKKNQMLFQQSVDVRASKYLLYLFSFQYKLHRKHIE
jgi:hypothetical protein